MREQINSQKKVSLVKQLKWLTQYLTCNSLDFPPFMDLIHTYTFRFKSLTHSAFNNIDLIGLSNLSPQLSSDKIRVSFSAAWCVETSHTTQQIDFIQT